jgi:anti-anti-sigma regulatory factor
LSITWDESATRNTIRVEGDFDVTFSAEMKQRCVETIVSRKQLLLNMSQVTDIDVTFIQLLWATMRAAEKEGIVFTLAGPVPENIHCIVREAGFGDRLASLLSPGEAVNSPSPHPETAE